MLQEVRRPHVLPVCAALGALAMALGGPALVRAEDRPGEPVEALREALRAQGTQGRKAALEKRAEAVTGLGDLSRALLLGEWSFGATLDPERLEVDQKVWTALADRFERA